MTVASCFLSSTVMAQEPTSSAAQTATTEDITDSFLPDSIHISLLTCSPRDQVYSLYGHTAIRCHNVTTNEDWVFNYGVFNFRKPYFVLRFTFGLTDYELGVVPFDSFCAGYKRAGCRVTEQTLNLTTEERHRLFYALSENYLPENRIYRYNFFYDNCTTRARDIIEESVDGTISYPERGDDNLSFREMIRQKTVAHPWSTVGNDLCLGVRADIPCTDRERQFLPENLMADFESAVIVPSKTADETTATSSDNDKDSATAVTRPLVSSTKVLFDSSNQKTYSFSFTDPYPCALYFLALNLIVLFFEYRRKKTFVFFDALLMLLTGLAGLLVLALFFSQHPTTSTNLQIFLLNPLPLFFIHKIVRRRPTVYWRLSLALLIMFVIGALFQDYADGMEVLALCLSVRCLVNVIYNK